MRHHSIIDYDDFFQITVRLLQRNLPSDLKQFRPSRPPKSGWIVVRYPRFKYSQYELHLSRHSKQHARYFGEGSHVISAFYYKTILGDSDVWIESLMPHVEQIQEKVGKRLVIGPWSDNWVWIAENLDDEATASENLSALLAQFIQATYHPIAQSFKAIGR